MANKNTGNLVVWAKLILSYVTNSHWEWTSLNEYLIYWFYVGALLYNDFIIYMIDMIYEESLHPALDSPCCPHMKQFFLSTSILKYISPQKINCMHTGHSIPPVKAFLYFNIHTCLSQWKHTGYIQVRKNQFKVLAASHWTSSDINIC